MSAIRPELASALERLHPGARLATLPGDASTRRFHRLQTVDGGTVIVMDYGAPFEGETDDVRLARLFERADLPVARVLDVLPEAGCLLLEDLGDLTLEDALGRAGMGRVPSRSALYRAAITLAARIGAQGTAALAASDRRGGPALDAERFQFEMDYFQENFLGRLRGLPTVPAALERELADLAVGAASHPRVLCHRDYHSRNLMVRGDGTLAMVDIQDARWGPDTYDVASLLRDAYVDLPDAEVDELLRAFAATSASAEDLGAVESRFRIAATQRMIKALGTFGYQIAVLGRERYRDAVPRTVDRLKRSLPGRAEFRGLDAALREAGVYS